MLRPNNEKIPSSVELQDSRPSCSGSGTVLIAASTTAIEKLKQGSYLWLYGFKEACCLHRAFILCYRCRSLLIRTGQCFLLNGLIFLGSLSLLKLFLIPMLRWILPNQCPQIMYEEVCYGVILTMYSTLRTILIQVIYLLWFYPMYGSSFVISNIWYNDIAQHGFAAMEKYKPPILQMIDKKEASAAQNAGLDKPVGLGGIMVGIGEQIYSLLLLNFFLLEVYATDFIPYGGKALNFLLLSWLYAYYCFEYKWNLSGVTLGRRLDFFESNWAFFAGFGSPCALVIFIFPCLESYAVMGTLFPLFVLTATGSEADNLVASPSKLWLGTGLGRIPIFYGVDTISMKVLSILPLKHLEERNQEKKA